MNEEITLTTYDQVMSFIFNKDIVTNGLTYQDLEWLLNSPACDMDIKQLMSIIDQGIMHQENLSSTNIVY